MQLSNFKIALDKMIKTINSMETPGDPDVSVSLDTCGELEFTLFFDEYPINDSSD